MNPTDHLMITTEEAANALNGNQYTKEGSRDLFAAMKAAGLVAVFGASDDLMEFRGAIHDEVGAWTGAVAYLTRDGLLTNDCDDDRCPHFLRLKAVSTPVEAIFGPGEGLSWAYKTSIPHKTFTIMEEDDRYCVGIVFALADVRS